MSRNAARVPPAVRRAAEQVVDDHVDIDAVLLFGSRARGDHRPYSDIDLAVVGRGCPHTAERALRNADRRVEAIYVTSAQELRARANLATALEAALVRQAVRIAGTWRRPGHRKENLDVSTLDLANNLKAASIELHTAITLTAEGLSQGQLSDAHATTSAFNAAERVGKALLWCFGEAPKTVHNLATLADQLDGDIGTASASQKERADLAKRLRAMNGLGRVGHLATYDATPMLEITEDTADRICQVATLQADTLRRIARNRDSLTRGPDNERRALTALARCARENIRQAAKALRDPVPQPLRHAALSWLHAAAQASLTLERALAQTEHPDSPEAHRAAKAAAQKEINAIAGRWLKEHPGAAPPPAAPPRHKRSKARGTPHERIARAITHARTETRRCLDADPDSTRAMSIASWRDLQEEARSSLETGRHGAGYLDELGKTLLGSAPTTHKEWARAADRLEYRTRLVDAIELASNLNERATRASDDTTSAVEFESCETIADLTEPAKGARTTRERETALATMGPGFQAQDQAHIEHVIGLLPRLDWRLEQIERRRGLEHGQTPTQTPSHGA